MRFLLDTHAFIWWDSAPDRLSEKALLAIQESDNKILLSVASVWEMQIKTQLGKLKLQKPLAELVSAQQNVNGIELLPIQLRHVLALDSLPLHHKDPFDRLLIAQAEAENAVLVSNDALIAQYSVDLVW
ncbi:MAG: type II toxin-antitoxin system VapC family toxin [Chloroflexota bacterium]